MKTRRSLLLAASFVALPSLALAQLGNAPLPSTITTGSATLPAPPTVQTGLSGNATTAPGSTIDAASGASVTGARSAPGASAAVSASSSPEATAPTTVLPPPASVSTETGNRVSVIAPVSDVHNAATVGNNTAATIDTTRTVSGIQTASFAARDELAGNLAARVDASAQSLEALRSRVEATGNGTRAEFSRALDEAQTRERRLRSSMRSAAAATTESSWNAAQSALVRDYSAYAEAVANAEAAAQGSISAGATQR